jgi:hypothetical protein
MHRPSLSLPFLLLLALGGAGCGADGTSGPGTVECVDGGPGCAPDGGPETSDDVAPQADVAPDTGEDTATGDIAEDSAMPDTAPEDVVVEDTAADIAVEDVATDDVMTGECQNGLTELCYNNIGECRVGKRLCIDGAWGECRGGQGPTDEVCDGLDNDCNEEIDDRTPACECVDGAIETCGTTDVGACEFGSRLCVDGEWSACQGNVEPSQRFCDNADRDCDGNPDHTQVPCTCRNGDTRPCGTNTGICTEGTETCTNGVWLACTGGNGPLTTAMNEGTLNLCNGDDDNCNGQVDEGCGCMPPASQPCGTDVGNCSVGTQACLANGQWSECTGGSGPTARQCDNQDRDCNGTADYLQSPCQCLNGTTRACGTSVGECRPGTETCTNGSWGACSGGVLAQSERCDSRDNDCDGATDENLNAPTAVACWQTPGGTLVCADPNTETVPPLATIQLDGRQSSDPDGQSLSYAWRIASAPAGNTATITNPNSARPSLFAQLAGDYRICLTVTDTSICTSNEACITMRVVPTSRIHVQLTWDKDDADVDLHFMLSSIANFFDYGSNGTQADCSKANDCFFVCKVPEWGGQGATDNPRLDIDNYGGFGPENVNLDAPFNTTFPIAVHYWCDKRGPNYTATGFTGATTATVRLYVDGQLVQTWERSLTRRQRWHVADLVWNSANNPPWSLTARNAVATMTAPGFGCADP